MPIAVATELISYGKASEMDVVLDLWLSAIYKDSQVLGSEVGPVVYLRNGTGNPLLNYSDLAQRWGLSRSTVGRLLKKLADLDYLTLILPRPHRQRDLSEQLSVHHVPGV